ncbi:Intraflagellar transport protein 88-like protein isoform X3 [Oopsacas minuta]|uniref:Intraflagellar transport protein 88-like protein isoform X3 n=1 Tax=Oopsacas minuta TaxID=111878 RepID=A0AAV7K7B5_9METZ|nr:Intraflagellar transport protein 88-like protein isoform X3 [Oopsacas minuta]
MQNLHLAPDNDEDDLYIFEDAQHQDLDLDMLDQDEGFQKAVKTSYANRPPLPGALSARGLPNTAAKGAPEGTAAGNREGPARPMTAIRGAGFTSTTSQPAIVGFNEQTMAPIKDKSEETPEDAIKLLEKRINELLEESAILESRGQHKEALDKAKDAARKERILCTQRDQASFSDQINLDLTYYALFNLANQYRSNQLYSEALNAYLMIVKNKLFNNGSRLRVNMGNVYFAQKKYLQAVKMYQMALDQISDQHHKHIRAKILKNIGSALLSMGRYQDAITSFEQAMVEVPCHTSVYNLILTYFAVGDSEKMKRAYERLVKIPIGLDNDEKYALATDADAQQKLLLEVIKDDSLAKWEKEKKGTVERYILSAGKVIAPVIAPSFAVGYDWCIEKVKLSPYAHLACELEISKALTFLKNKDVTHAMDTLKIFEKKDSNMASTASNNLAFLYYHESDMNLAEKYADKSIKEDRYNPHALVNKGCCLFNKGDYKGAISHFEEALRMDATLTEALHNLGVSYKQENRYPEALEVFLKLHSLLPSSPNVFFMIADLYDSMDDIPNAMEWFLQLLSLTPTDPDVLTRLADIFERDHDMSQAFQYRYEAYKYYPSDISNISWLGAYYMESQFVEKAIIFFERATQIQPGEVRWRLMVASCHRRIGNYQLALQMYKDINEQFPENTECLKFLVHMCTDLGLKEGSEYTARLKRAERAKELRQQREHSGKRGGSESRENSGEIKGRVLSGGGGTSKNPTSNSKLPIGGVRNDTPERNRKQYNLDSGYTDPLGDTPQRPRTSARVHKQEPEDEFGDEELGEDLLPE